MEAHFSNLFEDIRYERSLILLLIIRKPEILKQFKFTDDEVSIIKDIAPEQIFRPRNPKDYTVMDLLEKQFSD